MYYPFFVAYILTGLFIGVAVFVWALKTGQFSDQQRARFLAMEEDTTPAAATSAKAGRDLYCVFYLALAAIGASFALVGYALFFR
ncbi:putative cbb3-type cytochrome C oxidase maturation protein CcoS [Desulforapulum autotrophicum HRM2]|uniref:Cbb3-type cytochrome C oxidase maturation protein CcoS n=1 Tax=Desulforapulum autotrophicum (strain ATCC 43914 / DSM 3382 / VKM B-1955 / HRM2) TaxID=177437 RepID=C0Q9Q4_DESAH|nr:cbb3-type cytochrome oxidase assembly protein CcoS [Desulforapulum autotrophicum]ACN14618.1 putative cbb3-type cytochrome C oxidase maturation protein CcoS [Desulforapulum autotrophicum HRM2]